MIGLTLDTSALVAAERNERRFWTFWRRMLDLDVDVTVPAGVLAQAWRQPRTPFLGRLLKTCTIENLSEARGKAAGRLCGETGTTDVVDASVVEGAARRGDDVLTSDVDDLTRLADHAPGIGRVLDLAAIADV